MWDFSDDVCGLCWQSTSKTWRRYMQAGPDPCSEKGHASCYLYSKVSELEKTIQDVQQTLLRLVAEHKTLMSDVNEYHDPIQKLPVEIASHIFSLCFVYKDPSASYSRIEYAIKSSRHELPLKLGKVCRRWRQIAWSTPQLWSNVYIFSDLENHLSLVSDWIGRSGQTPVSIRACMQDKSIQEGNPVIDIIRSLSRRWNNLELFVSRVAASHIFADGYDTPLQRLGYLGLQTIDLRYWEDEVESPSYSLPDADRLQLYGFLVNRNQTTLPGTKWLQISKSFANDIADVMYQAQNIDSLAISLPLPPRDIPLYPTPIVFPYLRSINVPSCAAMLEYIAAPALQLLEMDNVPATSTMTAFLSQCPQLNELRFDGILEEESVLQQRPKMLQHLQLFEHIVTLRIGHLSLGDGELSFVDDVFLQHLSSRRYTPAYNAVAHPFLPCVEHFIYEGPRFFSWESIPKLFESTAEESPASRNLKTLKLLIKIESSDSVEEHAIAMDLEAARKFRELGQGIVSISVISISYWLGVRNTRIVDLVKSACEVVRPLVNGRNGEDFEDSDEAFICDNPDMDGDDDEGGESGHEDVERDAENGDEQYEGGGEECKGGSSYEHEGTDAGSGGV